MNISWLLRAVQYVVILSAMIRLTSSGASGSSKSSSLQRNRRWHQMPQRLQIVFCETMTLQDGDESILLTLHPPQSLPRLPSSRSKSDCWTYVMSSDKEAAAGCDAHIYLGSCERAHFAQLGFPKRASGIMHVTVSEVWDEESVA